VQENEDIKQDKKKKRRKKRSPARCVKLYARRQAKRIEKAINGAHPLPVIYFILLFLLLIYDILYRSHQMDVVEEALREESTGADETAQQDVAKEVVKGELEGWTPKAIQKPSSAESKNK